MLDGTPKNTTRATDADARPVSSRNAAQKEGLSRALHVRHTTRREALKQLHRRMILDEIRRSGALSRKDLASRLDIRPNTVTVHVTKLLAKGLLKETGPMETPTGRRPVLLDIRGAGAAVVGVAVGDDALDFVVTDLKGALIARNTIPSRMGSMEKFASALRAGLKRTLELLPRARRDAVRGVGVAAPGLVDSESGLASEYSHFPWWKDVPIASLLEGRFGIPTTVENDTRALALAEKWFGPHRDASVLVVLELSEGVGAAILIDGELFRGGQGGAGELGHVSVNPAGARCACGGTGCLETVTSSTALLEAYAKHGGKNLPGPAVAGGLRRVTAAHRKGEEAARSAVAEVGRNLGIGLAVVVNLLDPDAIVLCGDLASLGDALLEAARPTLSAFTLRKSGSGVAIHVSALREHAKARGAAAAAIERIFRDA